MKKLIAAALALTMVLSLSACQFGPKTDETGKTEPASTEPTTTVEQLPPTDAINFFSVSYGLDAENYYSILIYDNADGTAYVDYQGQVRKAGDVDSAVLEQLRTELANSGLMDFAGEQVYEDGEANASMSVTFADETVVDFNYSGNIPQQVLDGYNKLDAFFVEALKDMPEYKAQPLVGEDVNEALLEQIMQILEGADIGALDMFAINNAQLDDPFFVDSVGVKSNGLTAAAVCGAMMMTTPYSFSVVTVENEEDIQSVRDAFMADPAWGKWVCVQPSAALVAHKDNMVLFLMGNADLFTNTEASVKACGWQDVQTVENPNL